MTKLGDCFTKKKKLHNTENSTLNHKNVDSVDPEESYIHTYTFKFKIGIFFCQKPIMFFCSLSLSLKKRKFDIPIFLALRFQTIYIMSSAKKPNQQTTRSKKTNGADADDIFHKEKNIILVHKKNCSKSRSSG